MKRWYARPGDGVEVPVDGAIVDIVRGDLLIEIQTRGFSGIRSKVARLLERGHRVRVVHPVAVDRWIVKVDGPEVLSRRRSPVHGDAVDLFAELVSFPSLLAVRGLEVEVVLTAQEELRRHTPGKARRRGGWAVVERRLLEVLEVHRFVRPGDLLAFLPTDLPAEFTTADLARTLGRPRRLAQQMAYCFRELGLVDALARTRAGIVYTVAR